MKIPRGFVRPFNTYNIPSIINNSKVHSTYRENRKRNEDDLMKIYNKELVAFPYEEERFNKLLNIHGPVKKKNVADFFFNPEMYINVKNDRVGSVTPSHFAIENVDKCFLFEKEHLDGFFPEGLAGELPKDILMHGGGGTDRESGTQTKGKEASPDGDHQHDNLDVFLRELERNQIAPDHRLIKKAQQLKGVGLLFRKLAYEIVDELKHFEENYKLRKRRDSHKLDSYFAQRGECASYYDGGDTSGDSAEEARSMKGNPNGGYSSGYHSGHQRMSYKSRSFLIDGKRGTGKSCILNSVVLWAKLNQWLVIFVPDVKKYKFDINTIVRSNTNLYIQPELSRQFLEDLVKTNESFLKKLKVDKGILESTCLDGTHLLYNKKIYDDIIKKTIDAEVANDEQNYNALSEREKNLYMQKLYKFYYDNVKIPNLLDKFSTPPNLLELAHIGINNASYANLCIYALFEHLKKQTEFPLLIAVDQFNFNLSVSEYLSINFENTKYNGYIPTYYFTIPKLLLKWDANKYKRCVKIVSTCWDRENRRNFRPELLGIHKRDVKTARNFTLREFKNYVAHLYNQDVIYNFDVNKLEYFYMLTGGNGFQARKLLTTLY
ncbi:mitochondrial ribosomal protein S29 precursor, putative [Plasmodium vivax]|uniref:Small ribosomal subunit protein mS29 n=1 Tax=Plasmodium vivax TaxID=5855 RepID=A0A1G4HHQ6_PLAVI|nr:mitochondrial ribosomal protein S29 precursor, putative [Plasmodium vivax]SCO74461.1 mitochondrial ribosomal protein S29 precursor, putative [Plasmodium vivax]